MLKPTVPVEKLWHHYRTSKSVWRTGKFFGLAGQTVHEHLQKNGYKLYGANFTLEEDIAITEAYRTAKGVRSLDLHALAAKLGRPHHSNICRRARELGLTDRVRKHTLLQRDANSVRMLRQIQEGRATRSYASTKKGWYEFEGGKRYYLRSGWELAYARYLETLLQASDIKEWEYEPVTFWFEAIRRGVRSYTPDFGVMLPDDTVEYHEVKGYMDPKSLTKLKRMRIYHPDIKMKLVDKSALEGLGLI